MDPEIKRQLEEIHALVKDNHHLIRSMRRHQLFGIITSVVFWLVILIAPFYLYQQYVQPLVAKFSASPGTTASGLINSISSTDIKKLIDSYKSGL